MRHVFARARLEVGCVHCSAAVKENVASFFSQTNSVPGRLVRRSGLGGPSRMRSLRQKRPDRLRHQDSQETRRRDRHRHRPSADAWDSKVRLLLLLPCVGCVHAARRNAIAILACKFFAFSKTLGAGAAVYDGELGDCVIFHSFSLAKFRSLKSLNACSK